MSDKIIIAQKAGVWLLLFVTQFNRLTLYLFMDESIYPEYVVAGVLKSLQQANDGDLKPYISIKEMLGIEEDATE